MRFTGYKSIRTKSVVLPGIAGNGGFIAGKTTGTLDLSAVVAAQKARLPAPDIQQ